MNTPTLIPEALLADQLAVPRTQFTAWRRAGELRFPAHFVTRGKGEIMLTEEGVARAAELLKLTKQELLKAPEAETVIVKITRITANPRLLMARCRDGSVVHVRLFTPRVFARQFTLGAKIEVRRTESAMMEFHGKPAKKTGFR